jgi:hypothetical protein
VFRLYSKDGASGKYMSSQITGASKMENKPFVGLASIDINDGHSRKFRIAELPSTCTAEALAIGETLEIIEKIDSEKNFMISIWETYF